MLVELETGWSRNVIKNGTKICFLEVATDFFFFNKFLNFSFSLEFFVELVHVLCSNYEKTPGRFHFANC